MTYLIHMIPLFKLFSRPYKVWILHGKGKGYPMHVKQCVNIFPYLSLRRTFTFPKTGVVLESPRQTFFFIPHISVGGKSISIITYVPGSPRTYHSFTHIGHNIGLRNEHNNYVISFNQVSPRLRRIIISHHSILALWCIMS